jgi:hypothetical protein
MAVRVTSSEGGMRQKKRLLECSIITCDLKEWKEGKAGQKV